MNTYKLSMAWEELRIVQTVVRERMAQIDETIQRGDMPLFHNSLKHERITLDHVDTKIEAAIREAQHAA